jgi:hypothetical protein
MAWARFKHEQREILEEGFLPENKEKALNTKT